MGIVSSYSTAVNLDSLVRARQPEWTELDELVRRAKGRPERLGPDGVRRLGALYRGAVADLARGRRAFGEEQAIRNLEQLVARARATIYTAPRRHGRARSYLFGGYWADVRQRGRALALAWVLLLVSAALATVWAIHDPAAAGGVVPSSLSGGGAPHKAIGLAASQSAVLSVSIFINNIGVTFLSFALGIGFGVLPAFVLIYNGLIVGAVAGIASGGGHAADVIELVVPHGILELSCIAVCAAAGMRMGWALVEPGTRTRGQALAEEAPRAVLIVVCTAPWLICAGLVEGFVTPHHLPLGAAIAVGVGLAAPFWAGVAWLGRKPAGADEPTAGDPGHSRSAALAFK
jgi:uncharacterized membrane protein SpoIIM required for sporulation